MLLIDELLQFAEYVADRDNLGFSGAYATYYRGRWDVSVHLGSRRYVATSTDLERAVVEVTEQVDRAHPDPATLAATLGIDHVAV